MDDLFPADMPLTGVLRLLGKRLRRAANFKAKHGLGTLEGIRDFRAIAKALSDAAAEIDKLRAQVQELTS